MMVKSDKFTQSARVANYDKRLSPAETRIYGVLCDRVIGDTNEVSLNRNFLMKAVGCSATTLTRAIKHLMDLGYIEGKSRNFDKMTGAEEAPTYYLAAFEDIQAEIDPACAWVFNTKTDVKEEVVEDTPVEEEPVKKPTAEERKRTLKRIAAKKDTPKEETPKAPVTPAKKMFTRGFKTPLPKRDSPVTEWSGYDGTALAERDSVRSPLKAGKRVYSVLGRKVTLVMEEDGDTVNLFASNPDMSLLKHDILKYLKIPNYTEEQWQDICDIIRRNSKK